MSRMVSEHGSKSQIAKDKVVSGISSSGVGQKIVFVSSVHVTAIVELMNLPKQIVNTIDADPGTAWVHEAPSYPGAAWVRG